MDGSQADQLVDRTGVVLVADDNAQVRKSLKEVLELGGLHVLLAGDGAAALHVLRENDVDVLILDMNMPVHDGWAVLSQLDGSVRPAVIVNSGEEFSAKEMRQFFEARPFGILRSPRWRARRRRRRARPRGGPARRVE